MLNTEFRKISLLATALLILSLCLPLLAGAYPVAKETKAGLTVLDVCSKDQAFVLHGEMVLQEEIYSVRIYEGKSKLPEHPESCVLNVMDFSLDKPPSV